MKVNCDANCDADEVACADPEQCEAVCGFSSGCNDIAYPLLVFRLLPSG